MTALVATATDVLYGPDPILECDIFSHPDAGDVPGGAPAIVYVHGGGWTRGDKALIAAEPFYTDVLQGAANDDWPPVVFSINLGGWRYDGANPTEPEFGIWMSQARVGDWSWRDLAQFVRWLKKYAALYDVNPDLIWPWGNSAGVQPVLRVAYGPTNQFMPGAGGFGSDDHLSPLPSSVFGAINNIGIVNPAQHDKSLSQFLFGGAIPTADEWETYWLTRAARLSGFPQLLAARQGVPTFSYYSGTLNQQVLPYVGHVPYQGKELHDALEVAKVKHEVVFGAVGTEPLPTYSVGEAKVLASWPTTDLWEFMKGRMTDAGYSPT